MNKNLPLSNIVVLDLTNVLSGPFATQILSDLGAEIIKVEKPNGDDSRKFGPFIKKRSSYFISLNRGKKSIIIDFKNDEDKKIFKKLLALFLMLLLIILNLEHLKSMDFLLVI